jgi:ribosomal protein S14
MGDVLVRIKTMRVTMDRHSLMLSMLISTCVFSAIAFARRYFALGALEQKEESRARRVCVYDGRQESGVRLYLARRRGRKFARDVYQLILDQG